MIVAKTAIQWIEVVRALAALCVLIFHAKALVPQSDATNAMHQLLSYGKYGVDIFFVLSGFVVAYSVWASPHYQPTARGFLIRRFVRIYSGYWLVLLFAVVYFFLTNQLHAKSNCLAMIFLMCTSLQLNMLDVAWSLTYELLFYVAFSLLLLAKNARVEKIISVVLCIFLLGAHINWLASGNPMRETFELNVQHMMFSGYSLEFLFGVVSCALAIRVKSRLVFFVLAMCALMIGGLIVVVLPDAPNESTMRALSWGPIGVALVVVSIFLHHAGIAAPRFMYRLGAASFSLYLTHPIVLDFFGARSHEWIFFTEQSPILALSFLVVVAVFVAIGTAMLWYRLIERPVYLGLCGLATRIGLIPRPT